MEDLGVTSEPPSEFPERKLQQRSDSGDDEDLPEASFSACPS